MAGLINTNVSEITAFSRKLKKAQPEVYKRMQARGKDAGQLVVIDAVKNAPSPKIAATVKAQNPKPTASGFSVTIVAGRAKLVEAKLLEHGGLPGTFRHPVFGTDTWVNQQAHPYLAPALAKQADTMRTIIQSAVVEAIDTVLNSLEA